MIDQQMTSPLTADDIEFLTNLANALKTQNTHGTRKPIFIQVREPKKDWGFDLDYADGTALIIGNDEPDVAFTVEEAKESLKEFHIDEDDLQGLKELDGAVSFDDIETFCQSKNIKCFEGGFRDTETFHNAFLTISGYERHMKMNRHHYGAKAGFWVDHAFRNPELEQLLTIVEKFGTVEGTNQ